MHEEKLKHLEFIQNVITRMNTNSFFIKGWMITLVSALFALAAKETNPRYVIITYVAIPTFWVLDAFYLSQERQYRKLYDEVRQIALTNFSMDATSFNHGSNTWLSAFFSKTMLALYPLMIGITLAIMLWMRPH